MAIIPINVFGDRVLREKTYKIEKIDDEIIKLIADMFDTMRNANGGIGLAANQIGINKKLFVLDLSPIEEYKDHKPLVIINPEILVISEEIEQSEEGCLSLPGVYADVERPYAIKLKYLDVNETEQIIDAEGFFARAIQHENDHLNGKLFSDYVEGFKKKKIQKDLNMILKRTLDINYPISDKK